MLSALVRDARYGIRSLAKTPGITSIAIVALALGIGANTAIFTLVKAVLLSPLPYPEPSRLALLMRTYNQATVPTYSVLKIDYWRRNSKSFEAMAGFEGLGSGFNLVAPGGDPERLLGTRVFGDYFRVIGVSPVLGRGFGADENRMGAERVVVISHGLWQRRFGGDRNIVGRHLTLSGQDYEVLGVMPPQFRPAPDAELWIPLQTQVKPDDISNFLLTMARLRPGITLEQSRAEMRNVFANFKREYPATVHENEGVAVLPASDVLASLARPTLTVLFGAVAFVLLIACANVANLLLARATGRTKEIAIRVSMGATRWDLARQLLVESVLLSLAGAVLGFGLGRIGVAAIVSVMPMKIPVFDFTPDGRVLLFTIVISLLTGVMFGLAPAIQAWHTDVNSTLKESGRSSETRTRSLVRRVLVGAEVSLAVVLVIGAALMLETIVRLRSVNPGFDSANLLTMQMSVGDPRYADPARLDDYYLRAIQRIESLPGVESAATVTSLPLELGPDFGYTIPGQTTDGDAQWRTVSAGYFNTLRIRLMRGRAFNESDTASSTPVIIVNETFARQHWPKSDALGERVILHQRQGLDEPARVIVGVVADVKEKGLGSASPAVMYLAPAQVPAIVNQMITALLPIHWAIRTRVDPLTMVQSIKNELRTVDPDLPVSNIRTMEQVAAQSLLLQNIGAGVLGVFAVLALLLAAIGVYGVMSYSVAQRTHEIGIRLALGAAPRWITQMVLRQAGAVAVAGAVIGLLGSLAVTRAMTSLLFGVSPTSPVTFGGVALLLVAVALLASYVPAVRATRVDPVISLRQE